MAKSDFGAALTRRHFIHAAAGGAAALSAAFASGLKAAEAKELRILFPGGTWKDWFENIFVAPYAARSGMKAIWKTGLGWEPLVLAQRNRPQWDLVHESQVTSSQLGSMNAVLEWRESRIPNLSKIHPSFRYPHLAGKVHTPYGIAVNTKRIKKNVNSWWDLWDPAFAGKVAFPAWVWVGEDVFHTVNVLAGGDGENIDPGIAKLKELHKTNKAQMINNVEHTKQLLVSEDVWICPYFGARTEQAKAAGAPVEFVLPKEGGISWIWNTSIIAGRPPESIELAENFVNTTLEAAKQVEFCRLTGYPPTNIEVIRNLPPDLKRLELTEAQLAGFGDLQRKQDPMAQFAYRDRNKERWAKEVLGLAMADAVLALEGIVKQFGTALGVGPIDFRIGKGEFLSLLGPSGCGKTTTLNLIAGLLTPTAGRVILAGRDITALDPPRRDMGLVFQNYALFPHKTVFDNVGFGLRMRRVPRAEIERRVRSMLDTVGLPGVESRLPEQLSGGQRQRVALARALVIEPAVLLLDEPLSNLDAVLRKRMRQELRELQRRLAITTIFVTHDQDEAFEMSDRVVLLNRGRIEQMGAPEALYDTPANRFVAEFIGEANLDPGRVVEAGGATLRLEVAGGLSLAATATRPGLAVGDAALALIRPERIELAAARPADAGAIEGRIAGRVFSGETISFELDIAAGVRLRSIQPSLARYRDLVPGQAVWIVAEDCRALPAQGAP